MNYKRQEVKYNHFFFPEKILIGVAKDMLEEEARLFVDVPVSMYEKEIYTKLMQIDHRDRSILINAIEKWEERNVKKTPFVGLYWDIVLDFILEIYGLTSFDIANEMTKMSYFKDFDIDEKTIFDNMEQMRRNKGNVREQGRELITKICYLCKITEDIVHSGKGILYYLKENREYTAEQIDSYCKKNGKVNLKDMITDITGVDKKDIVEIPVQIAIERKRMDDKIYSFLNVLLDEMVRSRD